MMEIVGQYDGQVTGISEDGRVIVYCSDAPAGRQWHIMSPVEAQRAQVGARVRIGYVSTRNYGRWQVLEVLKETPQPERFRGTFDVVVDPNVRHFVKEYADRRAYAQNAVHFAVDVQRFPGVHITNVQVED